MAVGLSAEELLSMNVDPNKIDWELLQKRKAEQKAARLAGESYVEGYQQGISFQQFEDLCTNVKRHADGNIIMQQVGDIEALIGLAGRGLLEETVIYYVVHGGSGYTIVPGGDRANQFIKTYLTHLRPTTDNNLAWPQY